MSDSPVLVVGAGPAGLTAAAELTRHGVACRIVDRAPAPTTLSKATGVQARTLEVLHDMGVADELIARGHRVHGVNVYSGERRISHFGYDGIESPYRFLLDVSQADSEAVLGGLVRRVGLEVEREVELVSFERDAEGVTATLRRGDGRDEVVRTPYLLGFDGARSMVRHALGIEFAGKTIPGWFALADVRLEWSLAYDEIHGFVKPEGLLFVIPLPGGWHRLIVETAEHEADAGFTQEELQRLVDERGPGGTRVVEVGWITAFNVNSRRAARYRDGRVFIGGDAAHIHSPAGGQGLNTSIQDAYNLSWKLALVLRGRAPESLLESYEAERIPVADGVLRFTEILTRLLTLHGSVTRSARDHVLPVMTGIQHVGNVMATQDAEIDITYRKSPIVREHHRLPDPLSHGGPRAGDRAPDVEGLEREGRATSLYDVLRGTEHVLLLLEGAGGRSDGVAQEVAARWGGLVRPLVVPAGAADGRGDGAALLLDPEQNLHRRYGAGRGSLYLIRPDGYVGFVSRPADGRALRAYLDEVLLPE